MSEHLTREEAYAKLLTHYAKVEDICQRMEKQEKYSPFSYLASKMKQELRDIRKRLIEQAVREHNQKYMPNAKPEADFMKLMDHRAGELAFRERVIEAWFKDETANKQQLTEKSFQHIIKKARNLLPYVHGNDGYWGACRDVEHILKGEMLELRAYTWRGQSAYVSGSINYSLNSKGEFNALEKLVDLVTHPGRDAATVRPRPWITDHIEETRQYSGRFYGKHAAAHPNVTAFQFFKNDKLKIWFKLKCHAEAVAKTLVTGTLPKAPLTLVT